MNESTSTDRNPEESLAETLFQNIVQIRQTLPPDVRLIAVSKQVSVAAMRVAYRAGIRDFGENRIQEAETKQAQLSDLSDITWHFIGHLQANKAQKALDLFDWIHTVDDLRLAQRLNRLAAGRFSAPKVCLQVRLLTDPNKYGWSVPDLWNDLPQLDQCHHLDIRGIMTIAPFGLGNAELADLFQATHDLAAAIAQKPWARLGMTELSMGMSGDYALAIAAGATMIRLGRVLFGDRPLPPSASAS
jgi:PLP dependent protein